MIEKFFNPESVAVIGASRRPGKVGHAILESLKKSFPGKIYPVNPEAVEILGLKAYPSVLDIKEKIDLAVICVPAEKVLSVLKECKKKKIKAVIIISSGFSEIGRKKEEEKLKIPGLRIIGPNCVGVFDAYSGVDTLFMPHTRLQRPGKGGISFITQSGAFGSAILDVAAHYGTGVSKFVSIGNRVDVNEIELMKFLDGDPNTRCIALYLESVSDGRKFIETVKKLKKPVVCLKAGKSKTGVKAVSSHTGSLAGSYRIYSSVFKQLNIVEAKTTEELIDFSKALSMQPKMKSKRIAIVTDGGGFGIVATDEAEKLGLELPEFSGRTVKKLREFLPEYATPSNPLDLTGDSDSERYRLALEAVFSDPNIDGVVVIALLQIATLDESIVDVLIEAKVHGKPFVVCATGGSYTLSVARRLESFGIPVYPTPERAVRAINVLRS
ncbi:MAG: CoA-binding protein [Candidatus Micrarchaeota archaeon]|nr:CoA-binding protein [Candidatus Micrarchaeota archaeon]